MDESARTGKGIINDQDYKNMEVVGSHIRTLSEISQQGKKKNIIQNSVDEDNGTNYHCSPEEIHREN